MAITDDDEIEFEEEPATFTAIYDWVPLTPGLSDAAVRYYQVLRMHVNRSRGDNQVKATTLTLARMMGRSRGDKTAPWLAELVKIGAVKVTRRGIPGRYVYKIAQEPPPGWDGPVNIRQWYDLHREELAAAREAAQAKRAARRAAKLEKPQVTASTPDIGVTGGPTPVAPTSGLLVAPTSGLLETPTSGREPNVLEPNEVEPPPPAHPGPGRPSPDNTGGGGSPSAEANPELVAARRVLAAVHPTTGRPPVTGRMGDRLAALVAERLAAGWTEADAIDALSGRMLDAANVYPVLRYRVQHHLAGDPPTSQPDNLDSARRRACQQCGPNGWVEHPETGRPLRRCTHDPARETAA